MDICQGKNVYLVGIKGAGMAGLAQILKGLGYNVSGSDIADTFFTDAILKRAGIVFYDGFDTKHIPVDVNWAVSSGAYVNESQKSKVKSQKYNLKLKTKNLKPKTPNNPEIAELQKRGVPIVSYPEALAYFFNQSFGIAVTGTHGKSTTTGMIAYILEQAGKNPFALVGAELLNWASNARIPSKTKNSKLKTKNYFVIEADEYREQFLYYKPNVIVITNVDYDHPDYFATRSYYRRVFEKFKKNLKPKGITIENLKLKTKNLKLKTIGLHNQQNAVLAYETCKRLGVDEETIRNALASYQGLRRRLERVGEYRGAIIVDDYAHHPKEVEASLSALKEARLGKIIVLFHPHTYSRTKMFLKEFARALTLADDIYLLDIYASAREREGDVSSDDIAREVALLGRAAKNLNNIENAVQYMLAHLQEGDVLVTMGAGDVFRVAEQLVKFKIESSK